jgi:hypothetical protein
MEKMNFNDVAKCFCDSIIENDSYDSFTQNKAGFVFNKIDNGLMSVNDFNDYDNLTSFILVRK